MCIIQTLDDAEALLFLDKNFNELFNRMPADEVAVVCKRELSRLSQVRILALISIPLCLIPGAQDSGTQINPTLSDPWHTVL